MENKIYNDDVERIVNNPERQEAINTFYKNRKLKRQRKMLIDSFVFAIISIAFGFFGYVGWVSPWISIPVCNIGSLYSAYRLGRWFENGKCRGWH